MNRLLYTPLFLFLFTVGCASNKPIEGNMVLASDKKIAEQFRQVVLDKSATEKPDWLANNEQSFEKDGFLYFISEGEDSESYHLAQRIAKAGAAQELTEQISIKIKSDLVMKIN